MVSKSFGNRGPQKPHLVRGGGTLAEVNDLRADVEAAMEEIEPALFLRARITIEEPDAGSDTATVVLQILDHIGNAMAGQVYLQLAVFDYVGVLSADAFFSDATAGSIEAPGGPSATLLILTDANGLFQCTLTNPNDTALLVAADTTFGSANVVCPGFVSVTFTP